MQTAALLPGRNEILQRVQSLRELLVQHDPLAGKPVDDAVASFKRDQFRITVLGKAKRGKSTLINAWIGRHDDVVAPIDKLPATSVITEVAWAEEENCTVHFRHGGQQAIPFAQIKNYSTEEGNPGNGKAVSTLSVQGPFPGLERDLVLADTPGAGSLHEHHDQILHAFIPQSDAVVFLVTAGMPLDEDEQDLLKKVEAADIKKIFFVLNKVDVENAQDIEDAVAHNQRCLDAAGVHVETIHLLSAKKALEGDMDGSGFAALRTEISNFLSLHRAGVLRDRFVSRVKDAARPVIQTLAFQLANARKTDQELTDDLARLTEAKAAIERERPIAEREFTHEWSRAVNAFESALRTASQDVKVQLRTAIDQAPLSGLDKFTDEFPTMAVNAIQQRLEPASKNLEQSLCDASTRLKASYPSVEILPDTAAVRIRIGPNSSFMIGGLAGVATSAVGIALGWTAASAAVTTTLVGTQLGALGALAATYLGFPVAATFISSLGTASVAAPTWLALAGPVGWTVAGVGALIIPLAWRISKLKRKEQLHQASDNQIDQIFQSLRVERVAAIRNMAETTLVESRTGLERQLHDLEASMTGAKAHRPDPGQIAKMETLSNQIADALAGLTGNAGI